MSLPTTGDPHTEGSLEGAGPHGARYAGDSHVLMKRITKKGREQVD